MITTDNKQQAGGDVCHIAVHRGIFNLHFLLQCICTHINKLAHESTMFSLLMVNECVVCLYRSVGNFQVLLMPSDIAMKLVSLPS